MSITQRKHIRLTLEIPAFRYNKLGERISTLLQQISVGGCLIEWDETIEQSEEFRLEIQLPNKNWLPLHCKALYKVQYDGIGIMFQEITQFEQDLIVQIMSENLTVNGIPFKVDPFAKPKTFVEKEQDHADKNELLESENDAIKVEAFAVDD